MIFARLKTSFKDLWTKHLPTTVMHFSAHQCRQHTFGKFIKACNKGCFDMRTKIFTRTTLTLQIFPRSFVRYVQLSSEKTPTILKSSAFLEYPIQAVIINKSPGKREWIIKNGYTIVCLFFVCFSDFNVHENKDVDNTVYQNYEYVGRNCGEYRAIDGCFEQKSVRKLLQEARSVLPSV